MNETPKNFGETVRNWEAERIERLRDDVERLTAKLHALQDGTWQWIERRERPFSQEAPITANALAEAFGITPQAANNRLMRLVRAKLLSRHRSALNGAPYTYRTLLWLDGAAAERAAEIIRRRRDDIGTNIGLHDRLWAALAGYEAQYGHGSIAESHPELPSGCVQRIDALAHAARDLVEWSHPAGSPV